ncbi:hypothetical protein BROUX41_000223 [Berkeleyomyces rouxiae]
MTSQPPPKATGLSLYANLLDPEPGTTNATGSNSGAQDSAKKTADRALRFQPIRRAVPTKQKPKSALPKATPTPGGAPPVQAEPSVASTNPATATTTPTAQAMAVKSRLSDWAPTEADEWMYGTGEKRQRGGRKNKNKRRNYEQRETDWEDVYDPSRPTNVDEYLKSDERISEIREWKDILYSHRNDRISSRSRSRSRSRSSNQSSGDRGQRSGLGARFAPPPNLNFAPPAEPSQLPMDISGDEIYAQRQALSQKEQTDGPKPAPVAGVVASSAPVRYTAAEESNTNNDSEDEDGDDNSRPSFRLGHQGQSDDADDDDAPRSNRPGQTGFASRMMAKHGWTKGTGLGADSNGITSALGVSVDRRRKRPDAEGGGWAEPAHARTKIHGGQRKHEDNGRFGKMSEVVVLGGMLDGMANLAHEIDSGLGQEIGEECGEKYGRVDRLYIDQASRRVFIKFTNQISALRAVSELDGRIFNGNAIKPAYFDPDKFEAGIYD